MTSQSTQAAGGLLRVTLCRSCVSSGAALLTDCFLVKSRPQALHDVRGVPAGYLSRRRLRLGDGLIGVTFGVLRVAKLRLRKGLRLPLGRRGEASSGAALLALLRSGSFGCHWVIGCYSVGLPGRGEAALLRFTSVMRCRTRGREWSLHSEKASSVSSEAALLR